MPDSPDGDRGDPRHLCAPPSISHILGPFLTPNAKGLVPGPWPSIPRPSLALSIQRETSGIYCGTDGFSPRQETKRYLLTEVSAQHSFLCHPRACLPWPPFSPHSSGMWLLVSSLCCVPRFPVRIRTGTSPECPRGRRVRSPQHLPGRRRCPLSRQAAPGSLNTPIALHLRTSSQWTDPSRMQDPGACHSDKARLALTHTSFAR